MSWDEVRCSPEQLRRRRWRDFSKSRRIAVICYGNGDRDRGFGPEHELGPDEAVLMEPLAVAIHSVCSVGISPGSQMVVFGAGTVGLLCTSVAREFGAKQIVMVDVNDEKLDFAASLIPKDRHVFFDTYIHPLDPLG